MRDQQQKHRSVRRGFTLLEALMAAGILLVIVVAVTSAVTAGQQHAYEAHLRIAGTLAAEELMGRVMTTRYDDIIAVHQAEAAGTMFDVDLEPFPDSFRNVGRELWITETRETVPSVDVHVGGWTVRVRAFDDRDRTLADITRFVPEPSSHTLDTGGDEDDDDDDDGGGGGGGGLIRWLLGR